ncbi:hypothetical protein [Halobacillus sp. A5]|uniref:hypothetical protein n=1 Tax=Halobacillus sp. A5 TaxID=2880263 RepID=UPI0020A6C53F|nr:hypothetical protein [Halobacillus sp. A5]MCP3027776.1 hypothetical protein [Halobacillus sp. A5]
MSIKIWVISGIVYLFIIMAGYTAITGENPLQSDREEHNEHEESTAAKRAV